MFVTSGTGRNVFTGSELRANEIVGRVKQLVKTGVISYDENAKFLFANIWDVSAQFYRAFSRRRVPDSFPFGLLGKLPGMSGNRIHQVAIGKPRPPTQYENGSRDQRVPVRRLDTLAPLVVGRNSKTASRACSPNGTYSGWILANIKKTKHNAGTSEFANARNPI